MTKDMKIVFAPGAFDKFDGTQEELDEMLAEIQRLVETGEIFEKSTPLTDESFEELDEETQLRLLQALDAIDDEGDDLDIPSNRNLH